MNKSDYIAIKQFFQSETGKKFRSALEETAASEVHFAEVAYSKYECPGEQIAGAVNRSRGVRMVIEYIDSCIAGANNGKEVKK